MTHSVSANIFSRVAQAFSAVSANPFTGVERSGWLGISPKVGDKFVQVRDENSTWIIDDIRMVQSSDIPLVNLINERYPDVSKILSMSALLDDEEFKKQH